MKYAPSDLDRNAEGRGGNRHQQFAKKGEIPSYSQCRAVVPSVTENGVRIERRSASKFAARVGAVRERPFPVEAASAFIDNRIKELGDWRGKMLAKVRGIIHEADPEIV